MPGRVSTRTSTASRISRKSSVPTLNSRASTSSRISSPTVIIPDEGASTALREKISSIFFDAQKSTAGHRKLVTGLRKVQEACCYEPSKPSKGGAVGFEEEDFNAEVARCVIRLLGIKKSETVGDRVVRFLGMFLRQASEKDAELLPAGEADGTTSFAETPTSRLTSHILSILLPLQSAKDKVVRYRSTQVISHMISSLDSIDDEYFQLVRAGLLKRIKDKEAMVRVQAVLGLGRLAGNEGDDDEDDDDSDDDASGLLEKLLEVLQNDPSAEVRRSLLLNLPLTPATLPYLLERARDLDPAARRTLYSRLLPALGDFRHLSLSMREKLLRWGLRDRDEQVRKATARLFRERWIEDCIGPAEPAESTESTPNAPKTLAPPNIDALQELLERIDVVNSGVENGIALEALQQFWDGRPDYRDAVTFDDAFWDHLTAESVFLARSFNDFCRQQEQNGAYSSLVEDKLPEVTKLAFILERYANDLLLKLKAIAAAPEAADDEDATVEHEFVVEQLLHIAQTLDYSDEVGRRKMFSLLRETLASAELPEEITALVVQVLRSLCGADASGEREFCGVVLEAIAEVHDTIAVEESVAGDVDESFHSARSELSDASGSTVKAGGKQKKKGGKDGGEEEVVDEEKAFKEIMVNMKCLHIAQCMLENVQEDLQANGHLVTMLNNLVIPAVRSHEAPIRERGLRGLGLCCLLDRTLAAENLSLYLHVFQKGTPALQTASLETITDILLTHPTLLPSSSLLPPPTPPTPSPSNAQSFLPLDILKPLARTFSKALRSPSAPLSVTAATALAKLFLTLTFTSEDLLSRMMLAFFDPGTKENAGLRQSLSYFLPVYAYSKRENMARMGGASVGVLKALVELMEEGEGEEGDESVGWGVVGGCLGEWTDGRRGVWANETGGLTVGVEEKENIGDGVHVGMAEEILGEVLERGCGKTTRKALLTLLSKLHISAPSPSHPPSSTSAMPSSSSPAPSSPTPDATDSPTARLQSLLYLANEAIDAKVAPDAACRNALARFAASVEKIFAKAEEKRTVGVRGKRGRRTTTTKGVEAEVEVEVEGKAEVEAEGKVDDGGDAVGEKGEGSGKGDSGEDTVMGDGVEGENDVVAERDSIVEELLDDDEDE